MCIPQTEAWVLWVSQESTQLFAQGDTEVNSTGKYLSKAKMESQKSCDDTFHFKMVWPELGFWNEWKQSSNPFESTTVENYQRMQYP